MAGDFFEVRAKFRWARHQLALLNLACADYIDQDPYVARVEDDPEAQGYRIFADLRYPPPASLAHNIGDVLSNLHGTLDYLAWQLVLREGKAPTQHTAFPIVEATNEDGTEPAVQIVPAIEDKMILGSLRHVQPYRDGDRANLHPLTILRRLNRESKHRHPVVLATASVGTSFMTGRGNLDDVLVVSPGRVQDGDEVTLIRYADAPNGCYPDKARFTVQVALEGIPGAPEPPEVMVLTSWIADFIESEILRWFELAF